MKKFQKRLKTSLLLGICMFMLLAQPAYAEDFYLSFFYPPSWSLTTDTQYDYIEDAHITHAFNMVGSDLDNVTKNTAVLDKDAARGMKGIVADDRIWYLDMLPTSAIDSFISDYSSHSAFGGGYVRDEPYASRWNGFARAYNRFLYHSPDSIPYANLFPYYANKYSQLEVSPSMAVSNTEIGGSSAVNSATKIGQTFKIPENVDYVDSIEVQINTTQWSAAEGLTLTLWDSINKTTRLSSTKLKGVPPSRFIKFDVKAQVNPGAVYYWELSHDGGGDNSVAGINRSTTNTYADGSAYVGGSVQSWDFYFRVFSGQIDRLNASISQISEEEGGGQYVTSSNALGQKFTTNFDLDFIQFIELNIDYMTWGPAEQLTLKLWDSPSKTTLFASDTRSSTNNETNVRFTLNQAVTPNTSYYWELTHNGGGDNSVGKVKVTPSAPAFKFMLPNGSAYLNGVPQNYDFMFKVYKENTVAQPLISSQTKQGSEENVSNTNRVGQTFTTSDSSTTIDYIQLLITDEAPDDSSWDAGSTLTLKLWDSPSKTTQIGTTATLTATNHFYDPQFHIDASVSPKTTYYWEVTHSGGSSDFVKLASSSGDVLAGVAAYVNGSSVAKDMVFKVYGNPYAQDSVVAQTVEVGGGYISSSANMGQTFKTPSTLQRELQYIELKMDYNNWTAGEVVTVTLYDGTAKIKTLGSASLAQTNNGLYPRFYVHAELDPNTSYYYEVTHNGGGNNSIGLVVHSGTDVYANGTGYVQGAAQSWDMYFRTVFRSPYAREHIVAQMDESNGSYITPSSSMGQTFKTPTNLTRVLEFIELKIDYNSYATGESLTLTLYDSTAKNQVMSRATLDQTDTNRFNFYPRFYLNAQLNPDTTYYFEVTHDGGGNNSIGLVARSSTDAYADGTGYVQGVSQNWDMYFRSVFSNYYTDYLEEWVDTVGPNSLKYISFDVYPFRTDDKNIRYFLNLELVREIGIRKQLKTHMFLQSVAYTKSSLRVPSEDEMRYSVFTGLAYGMKGLAWFTWFTPNSVGFSNAIISPSGAKTNLYTPVQSLNAQVTALGPKLMDLTSLDVFHFGTIGGGTRGVPQNFFWKPSSSSDNMIVSSFKDSTNRKYIMVVNKSTTSTKNFSFNVNPKPSAVTEVSKTTGAEVATNYNASTGVLSGSFLAGEGKLYALPAGY